MVPGSAEESIIRHFVGSQRYGIGSFTVDLQSGCWSWTDAIFELFGYQIGAVPPGWDMIISRIPDEDRTEVEHAYEQATAQTGSFSWSHRIIAGDTVRSVLTLGHTRLVAPEPATLAAGRPVHHNANYCMSGDVIDLTGLRTVAARNAATEAVGQSAARRAVIEQAKGVLMLAYHLDADAAFALLSWHSQHSNRKVHAIAADLVGTLPVDDVSGEKLRNTLDRVLTTT